MIRQTKIPQLNLQRIIQTKKFKRTTKAINLNTSRSKGSASSESSMSSFYVPQKKLNQTMPRISLVESSTSLNLQGSRCTVVSELSNYGLRTENPSSLVKNKEPNSQTKIQAEKQELIEEIQSLKRHNEEYKRKIATLTETFDQHMKSCENKNTNKMKTTIKLARLSELEEHNAKLQNEIKYLKGELHQLRQINSQKSSSTSLSFLDHENYRTRRISEEYFQRTEKTIADLKHQNKELRLKIDYLNRKFYKDIQEVRQKKEGEYKHLKGKYLQQIDKNKQTSKENVELCVEIKKLQRQLLKHRRAKQSKSMLTKQPSVHLLELSSEDD